MLLRDRPPGTAADIIRDIVLYWNGGWLNGAYISSEDPQVITAPFELEDVLPEIRGRVALARTTYLFIRTFAY